MRKRRSRRDPAKERFWREMVGQQGESGVSVRAFCRERQLTESAFYFWRRELKQREAQKQPPRAGRRETNVERKSEAKDGDLFVPVVAECLAETVPSIEMILPSGAVLRWSGGDATAVVDVVAAVEGRLC